MVLGARMYDPAIGRFLSPDPILQVLNQYSYAFGNPVWFSDPDGTEGVSKVDAVSSIANAAGLTGGALLVTPAWKVGVVLIAFAVGIYIGIALVGIAQSINGSASSVSAPIAAAPGCAPARLTEEPGLSFALMFLVPLQVLLGIALAIRLRTRARRGIGGHPRET